MVFTTNFNRVYIRISKSNRTHYTSVGTMSNQSGISANEQLLDCIRNTESNGLLIIVAKITDDSTAVEFQDKFETIEALQSNLNSEPSYIFIKDPKKNSEAYDFISYVPDSSPVRAKMLYASTKNTLLRQIGSNLINQQEMLTEPQEVTDFIQAEPSAKLEHTLLTESERVEKQIAQEQRNMRATQIHPIGHKLISQDNGTSNLLTFNVSTRGSSIKSLLDSNNVMSFKIDLKTEQVEIANEKNINNPTELKLMSDTPSYTIYRNGGLYYFIYGCPSGSKVKERMVYASNKLGFINHLTDNEKITFTRTLEIGDADELEISLISSSNEVELKQKEESAQVNNDSQRFSRPKGPARRKRA